MNSLFTLLIGLLFFTCEIFGQCPPAGVTITSKADLENYALIYPDCEVIDGDLHISSADINDLHAFNNVRKINGSFSLSNNAELTDISGLSSLNQVEGYVRIQNNVALLSLNGLQNVKRIDGDFFYLENSPLVTDLSGLSGLDSVNGIVQIWAMDGIADLNGLQNLRYINGTFAVFSNASLTSFKGIPSLSTINDALRIYENPVLVSIEDLPAGLKIEQSLVINDNPLLTSCSAEAICNYLSDPPSFFILNANAEGCNGEEQVIAGCETNSSKVNAIQDFTVFPNPGNGIIKMENLFQKIDKIEVIDHFGFKKVLIPSHLLNINHLRAGIYIIRVTGDNKIYQTRYLKI